MKPLSVVGDGASDATERIAARLQKRGSVATVTRTDRQHAHPADAEGSVGVSERAGTVAYELANDGSWVATGTDTLTPGGLLDELAPAYDYVVLVDVPGTDVSTVGSATPSLRDQHSQSRRTSRRSVSMP